AAPGGTDDTAQGPPNSGTRVSAALGTQMTGSATTTGRARYPTDAVVRLRDVARVEMGAQNYNLSCTVDGRPSVGLAIYQLPGTNALSVAELVQRKMEQLKTRFPDGVEYGIPYDTT